MALPRGRALLGALILLAAALRFTTLDAQSFWLDEAATVNLLQGSFGDMLSGVVDGESTPPLYYVLAWLWSQVLGTGEAGLRALSAVLGTLLVPVAWALGERVGGGSRAAAFAALLVATNPLLVWFSQEARAYALLVLLVALSLVALLHALETPSRGRLLLWGAAAALALATHYFAAFFVVAEGAWLLAVLGLRHLPAAVALPVCAAGALAPLALAQREADRAAFIREEPLGTRLVEIPKQFLVGYDAPAETLVALLAAAAVAAALIALAVRARHAGTSRSSALAWMSAVAAASLLMPLGLVILGNDYLVTRNVLATLAPALVLAGAGLAVLPARAGLAVGVALALLSVVVVVSVARDPALQRDDWRAATAALETPGATARAVIVAPGSGRVPASLYLRGAQPAPAGRRIPIAEISVLAVAPQQGREPRSAPELLTDPPLPGFALSAGRRGDTWSVQRFRAAQPIPVDVASLANDLAVVLVQQPTAP